jgi:hypothetical protein
MSRESSLTTPPWESSSYTPADRTHPASDFPDNPRRSRFSDAVRYDEVGPRPRYQQNSAEHQRPAAVALEGRLSQAYEEPRDDGRKYRPLARPLSPPIRRDRDHFVDDVRVSSRVDSREAFDDERRLGGWDHESYGNDHSHRRPLSPNSHANVHPERSHVFDGPPAYNPDDMPQRSTKPVRIRRPPRPDDGGPPDLPMDTIPMERRNSNHDGEFAPAASHPERPRPNRRGGSLLDRLSLDPGPPDLPPPPPSSSLRDRVQIPSKRDRDEMMRSHSGGADYMDAEEIGGGPDSGRRSKRRSGRPKGRRGRNGVP